METNELPPTPDSSDAPLPANSDTAAAPSNKKRWLLISGLVILALLLIGGGAALIHHQATRSDAMIDNEDHQYEATVTIDSNGFMPGTLTVKPDTEVFFENHSKNIENETGPNVKVVQSKAAKNQAAEFNSGFISADSGYGYTFRKAGTYQFYNLDNVKQTVTVIVHS